MAAQKNKSKAEKAVSAAKTRKENNVSKKDKKQEPEQLKTKNNRTVSGRTISSIVFLVMFVVLLFSFFQPEGLFVSAVRNLFLMLFGKVGYIVAIPVFLYLFLINAFSGKRPVIMRSVCLGCFVLCVGCIYHLSSYTAPQQSAGLIQDLINNGSGVICGLTAMFVELLCGKGTVITYIVCIVAAILTLLAGMQITIPSIIRAIQERPRAQWEEAPEDKQEPAAVLVNHIAHKRIEYIENQRARKEEEANLPKPEKKSKQKADEIIRQINSDVDTSVAVASSVTYDSPVSFDPVEKTDENGMPPLVKEIDPIPEKPSAKQVKVTKKELKASSEQIADEIAQTVAEVIAEEKSAYAFPPIDLLKLPSEGFMDGTMEMRENTARLNETLASFRIEAHIINVTRGPNVTRYEVELEKGVRLSKLTTAADDIALSLGVPGVRIAAVPGKISIVGIEVPNKASTTVSLREVIDSQEFAKAKSKSSFAVGKDIGGNCIVGSINRLPHMLIAGTTGSGKSVCMNSIIISLLYKASPDDVKLIMVDPKMVELGIYNGIPHLLIPVVTDPKKAAGSLQWAVSEMMRRYKAMSDAGVRDLESYNSIVENQEGAGTKLPQVVVIIDELADLMLVAAKEVEESICRIAQMGRAAGIHLIIATQRPSANVITGLMKANIPSRIAFAVASAMESRIILDTQGAEKLVGKGDMLYAPIGNGKPKRVQGCFVSDPEVEAVASFVKENFTTTYDQQVMEEIERKAAQTGNKSPAVADAESNVDEMSGDEMLPAAVDVILETGQASVSMLQRRLKLGYARAARIVDEMEERGIVGPFQGSKPREILITKDQWEAMRSGQNEQMDFDDIEDVDQVDEYIEEDEF